MKYERLCIWICGTVELLQAEDGKHYLLNEHDGAFDYYGPLTDEQVSAAYALGDLPEVEDFDK